MVSTSTKTITLALAVAAATTEAHNKMTIPVPTWPDGFYAQNSPSGLITPDDVLPVPSGMSYNTDPTSNTNAYWTAFNASTYTSLKELAFDSQVLTSGASNECGFSLVDGTARDLPDQVQWDFFTSSHQGPCEVWCDDVLAFEDPNCSVNYPETPANLPYDTSKCEGAKVLMSIWIALHSPPWQVYTNCAPLTGATSTTTTTTAPATTAATTTTTAPTTATTAPTTATTAPTTATTAPSTATTAPTVTTAAPTATTAAPTVTTETPESTTSQGDVGGEAKCVRHERLSPFLNLPSTPHKLLTIPLKNPITMVSTSVQTIALALAVLAATTEAHNKMTLPLPTWPDGFYNQNSPSGTITPDDVLPVPSGMSYNTDSASNTEAYWTAFNASTYTSLKELAWDAQVLADGASNECGFSLVDGTAQDLPDEVQWDFFTASHQGPCEVWCDDTLVFEDWNCAVDYTETPANLPYDKATCEGSAVLTSYWIALHTTPWQIYTNCAPLTGSTSTATTATSSSSDSTSTTTTTTAPASTTATTTSTAPATTTATTTTTAPATTTATPTATTTAPTATTATTTDASTEAEASTDADADTTTEAPATTTAAPTATTAAPAATTAAPTATDAASSDKCSVRRRRH
ncbi:hypothetical protein BBJ28_00004241 [Nothophytophthora sp. Chile5]|nr:hypothetical protein BBJ28_00004241 [Nothophytophthora sp. Chile5]